MINGTGIGFSGGCFHCYVDAGALFDMVEIAGDGYEEEVVLALAEGGSFFGKDAGNPVDFTSNLYGSVERVFQWGGRGLRRVRRL